MRHKLSTLSINGVREAPHSFTVSIGIAELNSGIEKDIDALIASADKALYQAKNTGRDKVFYLNDKPTTTTASGYTRKFPG